MSFNQSEAGDGVPPLYFTDQQRIVKCVRHQRT